jgi:antirestriction protein ArdC
MMRVLKIGVGSQIGAGLSGYVAELGAAFLCGDLGITIEPRPDHAAYIDHWLKIMKGDRKAIFTAASAANKAAEYLLSKGGT